MKYPVAPAGASLNAQAGQFTLHRLTRNDLHPSSPIAQFHAWFTHAQQAVATSGSEHRGPSVRSGPEPTAPSMGSPGGRLSVPDGSGEARASTPVPTSAAHPPRPLVPHPETCVLSTAELPSGRVSARTVYLKELSAPASSTSTLDPSDKGHPNDKGYGFVVYSNTLHSRKAADLRTNPRAALIFWWEALERQVRVEGVVERVSQEEGQKYFDTRARSSQVGAWASRQSQVLEPRGGGAVSAGGEGGKEETMVWQGDDGRAQLEEWVAEAEERFKDVEHIPIPDHWGGIRIVPDRVEFWQGRESRLHDRFVYERTEDGEGWELKRLSP